jgi:hypothetical protein
MEIRLEEKTIRELVEGYEDSAENGVVGYGGKLNIRPAFQREFVYKEKERNAVIDTVLKGFPLNVMYWCDDGNGNYELLDGQQRTISICQYINNEFSVLVNGNPQIFDGLPADVKNKILDYKLMIYICEGTESEKLDWFKIINIAGVQLTQQELRNAVYTGPWLTDAKRYFSKNGCAAYKVANKYLNGEMNRQAYLEAALEWISDKEGVTIENYMASHQKNSSAAELWMYFQNVITWVQTVFPHFRKEMKGIKWGLLYNKHSGKPVDPAQLENEIIRLMADDDVTKKSGIYEYLLTYNEKYLSIRAFTDSQKRAAYERQKGICPICKQHYEIEEMEGDHITPWVEGGKTDTANLQMLCKDCNRHKSSK